MKVLLKKDDEKFILDKKFENRYLSPVGDYVQSKLIYNRWDDYNELYHATKLTERLKKEANVWFETHIISRKNSIAGVLLIVGGQIAKLEKKYAIEKEEQSLLLKYFHIVDKGKGLGSLWIRSVIFPHYLSRGFKQIYVNSSHPASFPFYRRLGSLITTYKQHSDNNLYEREGSCFLLNL